MSLLDGMQPLFLQTNSFISLQLTSGNVGLTENVEGEPRQFMVWVGTSVTSALVLHTFEVRSFFLALVALSFHLSSFGHLREISKLRSSDVKWTIQQLSYDSFISDALILNFRKF